MKKLFGFCMLSLLIACNNSKKDPGTTEQNNTTTSTSTTDPGTTNTSTSIGAANTSYTVEGAAITTSASLLVSKDKENLQSGAPFLCVLTSNEAQPNNTRLTLNFLLDLKPGTYPVVGSSLQRGESPNDQLFGGILGGKPELTEYKVTITECKDLGPNNMGGHRWSISGSCAEIKIKAMKLMLMDKTKNHPEEVTVTNIRFSNVTFEDNMDEIMQKAMESLKPKNQ